MNNSSDNRCFLNLNGAYATVNSYDGRYIGLGSKFSDYVYDLQLNTLADSVATSVQHSVDNYYKGYNDGFNEDRWVLCSEKLPVESLNSVIGWDEYRHRCVLVQYYEGIFQILGSNESFKITAWQSLPKPPAWEEYGDE